VLTPAVARSRISVSSRPGASDAERCESASCSRAELAASAAEKRVASAQPASWAMIATSSTRSMPGRSPVGGIGDDEDGENLAHRVAESHEERVARVPGVGMVANVDLLHHDGDLERLPDGRVVGDEVDAVADLAAVVDEPQHLVDRVALTDQLLDRPAPPTCAVTSTSSSAGRGRLTQTVISRTSCIARDDVEHGLGAVCDGEAAGDGQRCARRLRVDSGSM
jgi:hypothetical protein